MNSKVFPNCSHAKCFCSHILAEVVDSIGRHEETRTPDLYRVKVRICSTFNNLKVAGGCRATRKYAEADNFTGEIAGEKLVGVRSGSSRIF